MAFSISAGHNRAEAGATLIANSNNYISLNEEELDRVCLKALRCPDSFLVKNQLKANKDALLRICFAWIFDSPDYRRWRNEPEVGLLWIRGGAGKGKTMMAIGLVEEFSGRTSNHVLTTYFFCQNADSSLNTITAMIKGLIHQLIRERPDLVRELRDRWDREKGDFTCAVSSWEELWNIFLAMLDRCKAEKVVVVIDALDECQEDIHAFLRRLTLTGLDQPHRVKWLLTSRPTDAGERILLARSTETLVSLEVNLDQVARSVAAYVVVKVKELSKRWRYCPLELQQQIEERLAQKAGGTFLWVSLVCKELQEVDFEDALAIIERAPVELQAIYQRAYKNLCSGHETIISGCTRLLQFMRLAFRPLSIDEACSFFSDTTSDRDIQVWTERCTSFAHLSGDDTQYLIFIHKSARDFITSLDQTGLEGTEAFVQHTNMTESCVRHLSHRLSSELSEQTNWAATKGQLAAWSVPSLGCKYAATHWAHHLEAALETTWLSAATRSNGLIYAFLVKCVLNWLAFLSVIDQLPQALEQIATMIGVVGTIGEPRGSSSLLSLAQDAYRFTKRHYRTIDEWPLQVYSSAIIFSPHSSMIRRNNHERMPKWLQSSPRIDLDWSALQQTLTGHSGEVSSVAFSPDGQLLASGSHDDTVKVWSTATGQVQQTLTGHSGWVTSVAFSPDGQLLASGSWDNTVKVWSTATGQVQQTLRRHSGGVRSVAFSPDGQLLASASYDKTVKVWSTATGQVQQTLTGHSHPVTSVAFSPDGQLLASGSVDNTIKVWSTATGQVQQTLTGYWSRVWSVAFSPDGQLLASGSDDMTVKVWSTATGQVQQTLTGHSRWVKSVAFSPDGQLLASGSYDRTVKVWSTATGQVQQTLTGHLDLVSSVAFSPDGQLLTSGSRDKTVKVWSTATGQVQQTFTGHSAGVTSAAFSPDRQLLASGSEDDTVKVWSTATWQAQQTLTGHSGWVRSVAFSPDGQLLASGSVDNTIKVWSTATGQVQQTLTGYSHWFSSVAFSPDGQLLASGRYDTVKVWSTATWQVQQTLTGHSDWVSSVAFSPDGQLLASGGYDDTVKVWSMATGQVQQTLTGHSGWVTSVAFSPDGQLLASGSRDNTVKVWSTATWQVQQTLTGHSDWVSSVAFSPDGQLLASGSSDRTVKVWSTATGQVQQTLRRHSGEVESVAFSPDGQLLASASSDRTVEVWSTATGQVQQTLTGHSREVSSVAFSPDGQLLTSGSRDKTVKVWSTATGQVQQTFTGHSAGVTSAAFSPDGQLLASGSEDDTVKVWSTATGQVQQTLRGHSGVVSSVAFSPDGQLLASGSEDDTVKVWSTATGQVQQTLRGHSGGVRSVAFSPDGQLLASLASASYDKTVKVWSLSSRSDRCIFGQRIVKARMEWQLTRTFNCQYSSSYVRFVEDGKALTTQSEYFALSNSQAPQDRPLQLVNSERLSYHKGWIIYSSVRLLYIPPEYRVSCWDSKGDTVVLGCTGGQVLHFRIDRTMLASTWEGRKW